MTKEQKEFMKFLEARLRIVAVNEEIRLAGLTAEERAEEKAIQDLRDQMTDDERYEFDKREAEAEDAHAMWLETLTPEYKAERGIEPYEDPFEEIKRQEEMHRKCLECLE